MINIKFGEDKTGFGPGVYVNLDEEDVWKAVQSYLMAHDVIIFGSQTHLDLKPVSIYVDPTGNVMNDGTRYTGRGEIEE